MPLNMYLYQYKNNITHNVFLVFHAKKNMFKQLKNYLYFHMKIGVQYANNKFNKYLIAMLIMNHIIYNWL